METQDKLSIMTIRVSLRREGGKKDTPHPPGFEEKNSLLIQ